MFATTADDGQDRRYLDLGGLRLVAETLHAVYGNRIVCPRCPSPSPPIRAYCKDEGGKASEGLKRRQFRCRNTNRQRQSTGVGCSIVSCSSYIKRALEIVGEDKVDRVRREVLQKSKDQDRDTSSICQRFRGRASASSGPSLLSEDEVGSRKPTREQKRLAPSSLLPLTRWEDSCGTLGGGAKQSRRESLLGAEQQLERVSRLASELSDGLVKLRTLIPTPPAQFRTPRPSPRLDVVEISDVEGLDDIELPPSSPLV